MLRYLSTLWNQATHACVMLTHLEQWFSPLKYSVIIVLQLDQGINDTRNENAQQFAECAKEIIEILVIFALSFLFSHLKMYSKTIILEKGVVQPNVSSEVMVSKVGVFFVVFGCR